MDEVWGYETEADPHTIEVHIGRIRERFKDNPDFEIVTMRGIGYKVVKNNGTKERKRIADPILSDWCNLAGTCISTVISALLFAFLNHFLICRAAYLCLAGF